MKFVNWVGCLYLCQRLKFSEANTERPRKIDYSFFYLYKKSRRSGAFLCLPLRNFGRVGIFYIPTFRLLQ